MAFNISAVAGLEGAAEQSVKSAGFEYPIMMWAYGNPKHKKAGGMDYAGGFFIPIPTPREEDSEESKEKIATVAAKMAELLPAAGWEKETMIHADNASTEGYYNRDAVFSLIGFRKKWEIVDGDTRMAWAWNWDNFALAKEHGSPKTRFHGLVAVKGAEGVGPFILTLRGVAQMNFEGARDSVMNKFFQAVITPANALTKSQTPYRVFWMPVGAKQDAKGEPAFEKFGTGSDTSHLVMPALIGIPAKGDKALLDRLYVGDDKLPIFNEMYEAAKEWIVAWDTLEPGTNGGGNESATSAQETPKVEAMPAAELASLGL